MIKEDDIRDTLDTAIKQLAGGGSNPRTWLSWMVYLLQRLEDEAAKMSPSSRESFMEMLSALQDAIRNRSRTGGWN